MVQQSYDGSATLYLIPTPIGNMDDITKRSIVLLRSVDLILCEDTRTSSLLLKNFDISKRLVSCHEFNEDKIKEFVVNELKSGKNIGLITDQGSPIISDPGYIVCRYVIENGYNVVGLPGATAFVPALISSGINSNHFLYYGFLNSKSSKQLQELELLKNYPFTIIFYEAPHRIEKTLFNIQKVFGDRYVSISREISKLYEEIIRGKISECLSRMTIIKGEYVIVVEGCMDLKDFSSVSVISHINMYLDDGLTEMEAIKRVARERGVAKSIIYKEYINSKKRR